jgi:serine/threonine protein phosphatase PrpC
MKFACYTHKGNIREINEDSIIIPPTGAKLAPPYFLAIADGMGGHNAGEVASAMAIRSMVNLIREERENETLLQNPTQALRNAMAQTNDKVYLLGKQSVKFRGMGTTLTAALCFYDQVIIAHLGDSRAYIVHPDGIYKRITHDHTLVQEYIDRKLMTPAQAALDARRSILVKALGTELGQAPDTFENPWESSDKLLLCSDGVTCYFDDDELCAYIHEASDAQACVNLIGQTSLQRGGIDNISLCLAFNHGGQTL